MPEPAIHQRRSVRLSGSRSTLDPEVLRQRQCKRDEAIRKKLDHEFKKRGPSTRVKQTKKTIPGTVSALQPSRGLIVKDTLSIMEAAQLMVSKKSDCIVVVDYQEHLCGILTAKDIAYRAVATSNSRRMLVCDIMTPNPICVTTDTNAQDALNLMISRNFRHVPVCSEEGAIFGILDITKCLYEALNKIEQLYGLSQTLCDALEGVGNNWTAPPPQSISSTTTTTCSDGSSSYSSTPFTSMMMSLRDKIACPDLTTLLANPRHSMVQVNIKTNVLDVARLMREHGTTAVLVMDHDVLAGIFCTKDLVLRVLAAGIRPEICSVVRVMTPEPETALPDTSILQALKKMHDGRYLNLPVVDKDKTVLGLVNVLELTSATLKLINSIKENSADSDGSKFWTDVIGDGGGGNNNKCDSSGISSDDLVPMVDTESILSTTSMTSFPTHPSSKDSNSSSSLSISCSDIAATTATLQHQHQKQQQNLNQNDFFTFKFKYGNKTYRLRSYQDQFNVLYKMIEAKLGIGSSDGDGGGCGASSSGEIEGDSDSDKQHSTGFSIFYMDEDADMVVMTENADVMDAVQISRYMGHERVILYIVFDGDDDDDFKGLAQVLPKNGNNTAADPAAIKTDGSRGGNGKTEMDKPLNENNNNNNNNSLNDEKTKDNRSNMSQGNILIPTAITIFGVLLLGVLSRTKPSCRL